jgi:hypothetical protein
MAIALCRASRDERTRPLPGDGLIPAPMAIITHAITIDAPPGAVWPWLLQIGAGRAGWYAYDRIDNGGMPSARTIVPALQHVAVGDVLPALPGATDAFVVDAIIPERALVVVVPLGPGEAGLRVSWALALEPMAHGRTRLLSRGRLSPRWLSAAGATGAVDPTHPILIERVYRLLARLPRPVLFAVAGSGHYLMESHMLRGIKRRAEAHHRAPSPAAVPSPSR